MSKVKWGVLGYAGIAQEMVIPAIIQADNSEFYALASRDRQKLERCKAQFGLPERGYLGYDQLLADPVVEAVYIPLPNSLHKEWTIKAARLGKHVLCEKPLALSSADCREIVSECEKNGVKLMEGFMYRFTDRIRQVQQVIASGGIGAVRYIDTKFFSLTSKASGVRLDPNLGGGALMDLGCYPVNLVSLICGDEPDSVVAKAIGRNGVDVLLCAVLQYPGGIIANIHCGWINEFRSLDATVMGDKGSLYIPEPFWGNAGDLTLTTPEGETKIPVAATDRYRAEIEEFAAAVRADRSPSLPAAEAIGNMKLIETILGAAGFPR